MASRLGRYIEVVLAFAALFGLVTVEFAPTPLPQALATLSEAMGRHLECAPPLADEVLLARLKEADPDRVLREIAFSLDASWEPKGDGLILRRDPRVEATAKAEARRWAAIVVAESLKGIAERLAKQPRVFPKTQGLRYRQYLEAFNQAKAKARDSDDDEILLKMMEDTDLDPEFTPGWRALARIVATLGSRPFLALRDGERTLWSDRPTPMQSPLGDAAQSALASFRAEYTLVHPGRKVARFRLVATNDASKRSGPTVHLFVLDAQGAVIEEAEETLNGAPSGGKVSAETDGKPSAGEKPLELPEEARQYFSVVNVSKKPVRDPVFDRWAPRLADPVAYEPIRPYPGLAFLAAARAQERNVIGTLSDENFARFEDDPAELRPSEFLQGFAGSWTLRDGWIVAKPFQEAVRTSRVDGRTLIDHAVRQGGLDVDAAADWFARHPGADAGSWLGAALSVLLSGQGPNSALATFDEDSLRLWGLFDPKIRQALRHGRVVPFVALSPAALEELRKRVFWRNALGSESPEEITEILPQGLGNGTVSLKVDEEPVYVAWSAAAGERVYRAPFAAKSYGVQLGQFERKGQTVGFDRFRPGLTRHYTLTYTVAPGRSFEESIDETFLDLKAPPLEHLPEGFLQQAEISRKAFLARPVSSPRKADPTPR